MLHGKRYKIINTKVNGLDEVADDAKHRIGRTGVMIKLSVGMGMRFLYDETEEMLKTSIVENVKIYPRFIEVITLNTTYIMEDM